MRRIHGLSLSAPLLLAVFVTRSAFVNDRDAAATNATGHPLVGSWVLDTAPDDPEDSVTLAIFTSDGTYMYTDQDGRTGMGAWQPTSDTAARLHFRLVSAEGIAIIRSTVEVSAAGNTLTAGYTIESTDHAGQGTGEYGPARAEGRRMAVEPVGTLGDFPGGSGEQAATPAS